MAGDRIARATARIEAALRRIELAAQRPGGDAPDSEIENRYRALWTEANAALADLDQVIGSLER